jgi:hypothetical protein
VKCIAISSAAGDVLKARFARLITDKCGVYLISYYALPNGVQHGLMTYRDDIYDVRGEYKDGIPIGSFYIQYRWSPRDEKVLLFVDGKKSKSVKRMNEANVYVKYVDGVKRVETKVDNKGALMYRYEKGDHFQIICGYNLNCVFYIRISTTKNSHAVCAIDIVEDVERTITIYVDGIKCFSNL